APPGRLVSGYAGRGAGGGPGAARDRRGASRLGGARRRGRRGAGGDGAVSNAERGTRNAEQSGRGRTQESDSCVQQSGLAPGARSVSPTGPRTLSPLGTRFYHSAFRIPHSAVGRGATPDGAPHLGAGAAAGRPDPCSPGRGEAARPAAPRRRSDAAGADRRRGGGDGAGGSADARQAATPGDRGDNRR